MYSLPLNQLKPVDKSKIDSINLGTSYEEVVNILGEPIGDMQSGDYGNLGGTTYADYLTDKSGRDVSFVFNDEGLTSKDNVRHIVN